MTCRRVHPPEPQVELVWLRRLSRRRRRERAAWALIARETGLDVRKLQRWNTRARRAALVPVLRPVEVLPEPEPSVVLTLIAPSGVRIEGLGVQEAAQLLRLLA